MHLEVVDGKAQPVIVGGDIPVGKGINLPSSDLDIPSLTDKDKSTSSSACATRWTTSRCRSSGRERPGRGEEIRHPRHRQDREPEAVGASKRSSSARPDGVMVARGPRRGDPHRARARVQKRVIALANPRRQDGHPATADAALHGGQPDATRAEGDRRGQRRARRHGCVMLSEERPRATIPSNRVKVMDRILAEAEPLLVAARDLLSPDAATRSPDGCILSERVGARAIIVPTSTGSRRGRSRATGRGFPILVRPTPSWCGAVGPLVWGVTACRRPGSTKRPRCWNASGSPFATSCRRLDDRHDGGLAFAESVGHDEPGARHDRMSETDPPRPCSIAFSNPP